MIHVTEYRAAALEFFNIFHLKLGEFLSVEWFVLSRILCIDILKFDDELMKIHPYKDGTSMEDVVRKHYGEKGVKLIKRLL